MSDAFGNLQAKDTPPSLMTDDHIAAEVDKCDDFINEIDSEQRYANTPGHLMTHGGRRAALIERRNALTDEQKRRADGGGTDLNDVVMASRRLGRAELAEDIINRLAADCRTFNAIDIGNTSALAEYANGLMKVVAELRDKDQQ